MLYFLSKTTQALVLSLAELSGGTDQCDFDGLDLTPEEQEEEKEEEKEEAEEATPREQQVESQPRRRQEQPPPQEDRGRETLAKLLASALTRLQDRKQAESTSASSRMPSLHVNGPFQPNFGSQYNIGHLTVKMPGRRKRESGQKWAKNPRFF